MIVASMHFFRSDFFFNDYFGGFLFNSWAAIHRYHLPQNWNYRQVASDGTFIFFQYFKQLKKNQTLSKEAH